MSAPAGAAGPPQAPASRWWGPLARLSLQTRLIGGVLALLLLALAASGLAAGALLRGYLQDRVDRELALTAETLRSPMMQRRLGGGPGRPVLPSRYVVTLLDADGRTVQQSRGPLGARPPDLASLDAGEVARRDGEPFTLDDRDGGPWRVRASALPSGGSLVVATSLADVEDTTRRLRRTVLVVGLLVLGVGAAAGVAMVRASLRPLRRIETTAGDIAAGDLSRRVPEDAAATTEVGRLSRSLNAMLGQIEEAFAAKEASEQRMRRFVADASHELRTPLTSIRGFAELHRQGAAHDRQETDRLMRRIEEEATRMGGLVEDLLLLARLDRERPLRREPVDLVVLASDVVLDARAVAPHHVVELTAPEPTVEVLGDEPRLRQVLLNLVTNAVRHTPSGTRVEVRVRRTAGSALVEVADDGPGIATEALPSVFEGFTRVDASRSRADGGGAGLGLTIVAALVRAHGGEVEVESSPGAGATFQVRLPLHTDDDA